MNYFIIFFKGIISNCLLLFFLIVFNTSVVAQLEPITKTEEYIITKHYFSVEDGLAARIVSSAIEDKDGFMWFGTSNGLSRFDGNSFITFTKQNFGLLENEIASLSIDENNHLIIEFFDKNLNLKKKGKIQVIDLNNYTLQTLETIYPKLPFSTKDVVWAGNDANEHMFFVTDSPFQVWKYTVAKGFKLLGELTAWNAINVHATDLTDHSIVSIVQNGSLVLKKYSYPNYLITEDTIIPFSNKPEEYVFSIKKNKSFLIYNTTTNAVTENNFPDAKNNFVKQNRETFLHLDPVSDYPWWFCPTHSDNANIINNLKKGIYLIDDKSFLLIAKPEELALYTDLNISLVYKDSKGIRWICTNSGVIQVSIAPNYFRCYFSKEQISKPTFYQVRGIYVDYNVDVKTNKTTTTLYANVWQYLCNAKANSKKTVFYTSKKLAHFNALMKHKDRFYIGTVNTICEYNPNQNKIVDLGSISNNNIENSQYIWSLTAVSDNTLLVGHIDGISQFNMVSKKCKPLAYASSKIPKAKNVYRFVKTKAKGLVAVAENGLFVIDKKSIVVDYYGSLTNDTLHHLPINNIFDMYEDKKGICWIATNGEGLFRWDWCHSDNDEKISLKQFSLDQGLPSTILYRIEEDSDANLWVGTYNGLLRFNTLTYATSVYTTNEGLSNNEFNRTSSFKAADGTMYFGGLNGVIAFNPKQLLASETKKEPFFKLTSLTKYSGKEKKLMDGLIPLKQNKKIVLQPEDSFLIIEFQLLDFKKRKHLYAYKLDGFDTQWNYIEDNVIRLTGLPYGKYKMYIIAQMANGQWTSNSIVFPIIVLKPFYLETWFLLAIVLVMGISIFGFFRYRTKKNIIEKHELELKIAERTTDLQTALQDRERLLIEIHHRVKNNLHVINGLLQLQKEELLDPSHKAVFAEGQSRIESIALIHQNLYKKDNLASIEFHSFIHDLSLKVANLYDTLDNPVAFTIQKKDLFIDLDTAVPLGLIVNELLINSYKNFDVKKRNRAISIEVKILAEGEYELIYKDNGSGLPKDIDFETDKTLGLKLIKGLAKQLSGNASYRYDKECVFIIFFQDSAIRYNS
jgi:two-component sensor histidine kinase/ligand-binding sensor domain-containing protein